MARRNLFVLMYYPSCNHLSDCACDVKSLKERKIWDLVPLLKGQKTHYGKMGIHKEI